MPAPDSASRYYRRQQRLAYVTLTAVQRAWRRMRPSGNWQEQYAEDVGPRILALLAAAQIAATTEADSYVPSVLTELGIDPDGPSVPRTAFAGYAGDGRPVETLMEQSVTVAAAAYDSAYRAAGGPMTQQIPGAVDPASSYADALTEAEKWITLASATLLSDTARAAESAGMASRPQVAGYVRMLNPPSCSRCAILAGKFYRWNSGFERHPRCDCRHIPLSEAMSGDYTTDPDAYFKSLPSAAELNEKYPDLTVAMRRDAGYYSQEDIFTGAGAQAIRDGANMGRVVNARRGMSRAQDATQAVRKNLSFASAEDIANGAPLFSIASTETITIPGTSNSGLLTTTTRATRKGGRKNEPPRLMPESIYQIATDRADAIRLLRLHGYITG